MLGSTGAAVDTSQIKTQVLADVQSSIPQPANTPPLAERTGAAIGTEPTRFALADHQHPRLTSTTYGTLDSSGLATINFTRTFVNKPGLNFTETDATASSQVLVIRGLAWIKDANGLYVGVNVQGKRSQVLPTMNVLSGTLTLLTQVVTGVNSLISTLTNYDVFGGSAAGATFSCVAIARSDVSPN